MYYRKDGYADKLANLPPSGFTHELAKIVCNSINNRII